MIRLDLPQRTTPRPVARPARMVSKRFFAGAAMGRLTNDWVSPRTSPSSEIKWHLAVLRQRARNEERNNPLVARYFKLIEKNIVGPHGFGLRVRGRRKDGALDKETNRHIAQEFALWGRRGMCEVSGFFSFVGAQAMAIRTTARDGETFVRHLTGWDNPWGYAIQFLDADQFEETYEGVNSATGGIIVASIERDSWGRPMGYHALTAHPDDPFNQRERKRLSASQITHLYRPRRAGAPRGESWLAPVLKGTHDIAQATEAVVVNMRVSAAKMGWIERTEGDDEDEEEWIPMEADPGVIDRLNPGEKFVSWDPTFPMGEYGPFKSSITEDHAAALDVAHHSLTGNYSGVTWHSSRTASNDERDGYRQAHGWFGDGLLQEIYAHWLPQAVLSGRVKVPGGDFRPYLETKWQPRGWKSANPKDDAAANAMQKAFGFTSASRIVAEEHGDDYETLLEERKQDRELEASFGDEPMVPSQVQFTTEGGKDDDGGEGVSGQAGREVHARDRDDRPRRNLTAL